MRQTRFYFHDLQVDEIAIDKVMEILDLVKAETDNEESPPHYIEGSISKIHIQIINKENEGNIIYFFGKLIQSHKSTEFKEENMGELIDIEIDENSGICEPQRGVIYFMAYFDKTKDERILMVEDVPFALNIGGLVTYLKNRLEIDISKIRTKQKLGRNIIPILDATGDSEMVLARIRFKKNVTVEDIKRIGVVEDAFEKLKEHNLDCELIIRWSRSNKEKLKDFIKKLFKIQNTSDITLVDYGSLLRTLSFQIDNESHPKINMKDDIIKFVPSQNKDYYFLHELELYTEMKTDFNAKHSEGKLNG